MKIKILTLLLSCFLITVQAQKKKQCQLVYDKELGLDVYQDIDSLCTPLVEDSDSDYFLSENARFKVLNKKYPEDQMIRMAYWINTDGKYSLIKVLSPTGDPEIEAEAQRIINNIPQYKPCKCGNEVVRCHAGIQVRLYPKKKEGCEVRSSCKSAQISKDKINTTYMGNVYFEAAKIKIEGADTVYYNSSIKKMIAINPKKYTFDGEVINEKKITDSKRFEYTLGENKLYLK